MAKVAIIGAGFAGHTAAIYLGNSLGRDHEIIMINKYSYFLYLPSLVWVGVGHMAPDKVQCPLQRIYERIRVRFLQGTATAVHPDEHYLLVDPHPSGHQLRVDYDYLLIATGPRLNWEATPGLGPKNGYTHSICWLGETIFCRDAYFEQLERMRRGEKVRMVIGTGHPAVTCQGAAFEYLMNIQRDLVAKGLRDRCELTWLSNEPALGDFGVGGLQMHKNGRLYTSDAFIANIFKKSDIHWAVNKGVTGVDEREIHWEDDQDRQGAHPYDFAMLIPQFQGVPLQFIGAEGQDLSAKVVNEDGFVLVDGFYGLPYESLQYTPEAWPATYQNPNYRNIFAAGIAFAVPGPISEPQITPKGTYLTATAPRTGMVSGIIGRLVAKNIIELVQNGTMAHQERMTEMFATCIASLSNSFWRGSAVSVIVYPVVPNHVRYPDTNGRNPLITHLEQGASGAWLKRLIHTTMMYKAKSRPGWQFIPE